MLLQLDLRHVISSVFFLCFFGKNNWSILSSMSIEKWLEGRLTLPCSPDRWENIRSHWSSLSLAVSMILNLVRLPARIYSGDPPRRPFSAPVKDAPSRFAAPWINLLHTLILMNSETCAPISACSSRGEYLVCRARWRRHLKRQPGPMLIFALRRATRKLRKHAGETLLCDATRRVAHTRRKTSPRRARFKAGSRKQSKLIDALINAMQRSRRCFVINFDSNDDDIEMALHTDRKRSGVFVTWYIRMEK